MLTRVVELPRAQAIKIAKLERDSLGLRAQSSARCAGPWREAQDQANRVVQNLYAGADAAAGTAAVKVGYAWKKAADCEGWPTSTNTARPGEVNYPIVDRFTLVHAGFGALLSIMGASRNQALAVAIGWELLERPLKRSMPQIFPHSTQDTILNMIGDAVANYLGYSAMEKLR